MVGTPIALALLIATGVSVPVFEAGLVWLGLALWREKTGVPAKSATASLATGTPSELL
jgi:hypothetical protein